MANMQNLWWAQGKPHPFKGKTTKHKGKRKNIVNRKGRILNCPWCHAEFNADKPTEMYCSLRCSIDSGHRGRQISKGKGDKTGWVTSRNNIIRNSAEYKQWRKAVFERDNYTCQHCGARGVELNADHIKQFAYYPDLRLDIGNGRTLCVPCHKATDTYKRNSYRNELGMFITKETYLEANI